MADIRWIGAAPTRKQIDIATVGGTIEVGDLFKCTIGTKTISIPATTTVIATTAQDIADYWAKLDSGAYPEFTEISCQANGVYVTFESKEAGKPFTITVSTTEANGDASDGQTFTIAASVLNSSPNALGVAANYSGGALPTDGDTLIVDTDSPDILWDLEALSAVQLAVLIFTPPTTVFGLTDQDRNRYPQYRPRFFKCRATSVRVKTNSPLMRFDFQTFATTLVVENTGTSQEPHRKALCVKGSNAANHVRVLKGSVGLAMMADETCRYDDLRVGYVTNIAGDADVECGAGATLSAVIKNGGALRTRSNVASGVSRGGSWTHEAGDMTAVTVEGGELIYNSDGTLGTPILTGTGRIDFSRDPRGKSCTNPIELYGNGVKVVDTANSVNAGGSLVFDFNQGADLSCLELGPNVRMTRATPA